MPFKPKALVTVITCRHCKGKGCNYCQNQGVHGEMEGQTLIFDLPLFLAVKARKNAKIVFVIKRILLFIVCALLIYLVWKYLVFSQKLILKNS